MIDAGLTELSGKWKTKIGDKEVTPFPDPFACEHSRGFNLYFPIAYAKHCKITVEKSDIYYHSITARIEGDEWRRSFKELQNQADRMTAISGQLKDPQFQAAGPKVGRNETGRRDDIEPGAEKTVTLPEGARSVKAVVVTVTGAKIRQRLCRASFWSERLMTRRPRRFEVPSGRRFDTGFNSTNRCRSSLKSATHQRSSSVLVVLADAV